MSRLPADEDYARALLAIFLAKKIGARQTLRLSEAKAFFLQANMGRLADFEAALLYATSGLPSPSTWSASRLRARTRCRRSADFCDRLHSTSRDFVPFP